MSEVALNSPYFRESYQDLLLDTSHTKGVQGKASFSCKGKKDGKVQSGRKDSDDRKDCQEDSEWSEISARHENRFAKNQKLFSSVIEFVIFPALI